MMHYKKNGHEIFGQKDFPANYWNVSENIVYYILYVILRQTNGISKLYFKSFKLQLTVFNIQPLVFTTCLSQLNQVRENHIKSIKVRIT